MENQPAVDLSDTEIEWRKRFFDFTREDVSALKELEPLAEKLSEQVIEDFYDYLLSFPEAADFFGDDDRLKRVKVRQREYFVQLTRGEYEGAYFQDRLKVGAAHEHAGIPMKSYLGMYAFYLSEWSEILRDAFPRDPQRAIDRLVSLGKIVFLDISVAIETYLVQREQTISEQQRALAELPTPVLQIRDGLLILPIVGNVDSVRAKVLMGQLLNGIRSARAKVTVIDITGVPVVDSNVASVLVNTVEASRLLGSDVIVSGISAEIAQTLVRIGVRLETLDTVADLQRGLEQAVWLLDRRLKRQPRKSA